MKFSLFFAIACLSIVSASAQDSPSTATRRYESTVKKLRADYGKQYSKLDKTFQADEREARRKLIKSLTAAMEAAAKKVDLETANKIKAQIDDLESKEYSVPNQSSWATAVYPKSSLSFDFLGVERQWINSFKFLPDGSVKSDHDYDQASWHPLSGGYVIFRYTPNSGYIVFEPPVDGVMRGFRTDGRVRHLRIKK